MTDERKVAIPEEQELARKLAEVAELEEELADLELELADTKLRHADFQRRYLAEIAVRYAELDRLRAQLAQLRAEADPLSEELLDEARRSVEQAEATARAIGDAPDDETVETSAPQRSASLKSLFREAARMLHPDLELDPELKRKREQLMKEANDAYDAGDEARIREIIEEWQASPDSVKGEGVGADLVRTIRKIAQARLGIERIQRELGTISSSPLWQLYLKRKEAEKEGRDLLAEITAELDVEIASVREELLYVQ